MTRIAVVLTLTAAAALVPLGSAQAAAFRDTVYRPAEARASALPAFEWTAPDGHTVRLRLSRSIGLSAESIARAESYTALLESKLHSFEMSRLTIQLVRLSELAGICGRGAAACYGQNEMVVPYGELTGMGVSVAEVITHEYGHHVAAHRRNSMGRAISWGPQAWASHEAVCWRRDSGRLFRGYWDNPGEAFAEAYARLHYPASAQAWDYTRLLRPDAQSFEAIRFDVLNRLSRVPSRTAFQGSLGPARRTQAFTLGLSQDSRLTLALNGPRGADYDIRLETPGYYDEVSRAAHARDRLSTTACFAEGAPRKVRISITRRRGAGPFELSASYFDRYDRLG